MIPVTSLSKSIFYGTNTNIKFHIKKVKELFVLKMFEFTLLPLSIVEQYVI